MNKCIIFDCDGTLVDSEYLCNLGLEIKLKEMGVEESAENLVKEFRGYKLANCLDILSARHDISFDDHFIPTYRTFVDELFEDKLKACDGVVDILERINTPVCVASSGPYEKILKALTVTNLLKYFEGKIFSSYNIKSWKPDPGIFLHAANTMGFLPRHCVVVEDSLPGIQAAKSAGMKPVLYDPGYIHEPMSDVTAIRHMKELSRVIALL